jgi:hypothetical protein
MRRIVEIHVPISPTESFFQQMHYLSASLQQRGGRLRNCPIIVTVGEDCEPFDIRRRLSWTRHYPIEFRWIPRRLYQKHSYYATAAERFRYNFRSPFVLLLDADMVLSRNLNDLLERVSTKPALYAMPAYGSPWGNSDLLNIRNDDDWWREAFRVAEMGEPPFICEYSGHRVIFNESIRNCPPYFNQGVVLAPSAMIAAVGSALYQEMDFVNKTVEIFYRLQVALTLAIVRQEIPWRPLPIRYNYMTFLVGFAMAMPEEWEDVRIIHYGNRTTWFPKDRFMTTLSAMDAWLELPSHDRIERDCQELFRGLHNEVKRCQLGMSFADRISLALRRFGLVR